jgi:hypothetical protein
MIGGGLQLGFRVDEEGAAGPAAQAAADRSFAASLLDGTILVQLANSMAPSDDTAPLAVAGSTPLRARQTLQNLAT